MLCKIGFGDGHIVLFVQCEHPGDEGKNFCQLWLIDVSLIAMHASRGGGFNRRQTLSFVI